MATDYCGLQFGTVSIVAKVGPKTWLASCSKCGNSYERSFEDLWRSVKQHTKKFRCPNCSYPYKSYEGKQFHRITVLEVFRHKSKPYAKAVCQCGTPLVKPLRDLKSGNTKSCGCLNKEVNALRFLTHGKSRTRIYRIWSNMIQRCENSKNPSYDCYGGRGITVCKSWHSFETFLRDMGEPGESLTIDRKDNGGNYCKTNCKWATYGEQLRNTRRNHLLTLNGQTKPLCDWVIETGLAYHTIFGRLRNGWSVEDALMKPLSRSRWHTP